MRSSWMQLTAGLPIAVDIKFMLAQPRPSLRTEMEPLLKVSAVAPAQQRRHASRAGRLQLTLQCDPHVPLRPRCKMFGLPARPLLQSVVLTSSSRCYSLTYTTVAGTKGCALPAVLSIAASQAALLRCCSCRAFLQAELRQHDDIVMLPGIEAYKNLPNKTFNTLRYGLAADPP